MTLQQIKLNFVNMRKVFFRKIGLLAKITYLTFHTYVLYSAISHFHVNTYYFQCILPFTILCLMFPTKFVALKALITELYGLFASKPSWDGKLWGESWLSDIHYILRRCAYDAWPSFHSVENEKFTPIENILCQTSSLVSIVKLLLSRHFGLKRVWVNFRNFLHCCTDIVLFSRNFADNHQVSYSINYLELVQSPLSLRCTTYGQFYRGVLRSSWVRRNSTRKSE